MRQTQNVLKVQESTRGPLSPRQVWWSSDFTAKTIEFFVCPSCFRRYRHVNNQ